MLCCVGPEPSTLYSLQLVHGAACSVVLWSVLLSVHQAAAGDCRQDPAGQQGRLHAARANILHQPHPNLTLSNTSALPLPLTGPNHWLNIMVWWSGVQCWISSEIWTRHFNEKLTDKNTFNKDGWSIIFPCTFKTSWALQDLDDKRRDY